MNIVKQIQTEPEFLDKRAASIFTSLSPRTLDTARAKGNLPFIRFGRRRVLFKRIDLNSWLNSMRVDAGQAAGERGAS